MEIHTKRCNPANYGGARGQTDYIVVHYTANQGDTAQNNAAYFARETVQASAHYFVDEDQIWSSVPEQSIAWHCGAKTYWHPHCRNANSLGVELCMTGPGNVLRRGSIERGAQLVRALMQQYGIPPENVLRHYDVTGKHCPAPFVEQPALWTDFKAALCAQDPEQMEDEQMKIYNYVQDMPGWAQQAATKAIQKGVLAMDETGAVSVYACNLQPLVWLERTGALD